MQPTQIKRISFLNFSQTSMLRSTDQKQKGVALVFVLIMMTMVFSIAAITSKLVTNAERTARNDRDRQTAFQAAEAALSDAEIDLMGPNTFVTQRVSSFDTQGASIGCLGTADMRGFCGASADPTKPNYRLVDFDDTTATRKYTTYGEFTGREDSFAFSSNGALPSKLPKYIIEKVTLDFANRGLPSGNRAFNGFVITAVGYGLNADTKVYLQALISKPIATND